MARGVRAGQAFVELFADDAALAKGLDAAQRRLQAFGSSLQGIGTNMTALSASVLAPFAAGTKVYADFENQMARVSTALERPQVHMANFKKGIRDLAVSTGESTSVLSDALYDILGAAIAPEKAMAVLTTAVKAAKAGMTETSVAADALTTVLNAYGLDATKAGDVSDWLFKIVERGKLTFQDVAQDIGKTASIAHTAGVPLNELGAMIALLTRNGVQSSQAMTAINGVMTAFLKPSDEASKAAAALGLRMDTTTLKTKGLQGVFQMLQGLPPEIITKLFPNVEALKAVFPAMANLQAFGQDVAAMAGRAGVTETAYAKMSATMTASFSKLQQVGAAVLEALGEATSEAVTLLVKESTKSGIALAEWIRGHRDLVNTGLKAAIVVGAVGTAFVGLGTVVNVVAYAIAGMKTLVAAVGAAIGFLTSPIALVIVALAAVSAAFYKWVPVVKWAVDSVSKTMGSTWAAVWAAMKAGWELALAVWSGNTSKMDAAWVKFTRAVDVAWRWVQRLLEEAWEKLKVLWSRKTEILQSAWAGFTKALGPAWSVARKQLDTEWISLGKAWEQREVAMSAVWKMFVASIKSEWKKADLFLTTGWLGLFSLWSKGGRENSAVWGAFTSNTKSDWKRTQDFLASAWNVTKGDFKALADYLKNAWTYALRDLKNAWNAFWRDVMAQVASLPGMFSGPLSDLPRRPTPRPRRIAAVTASASGERAATLTGQIGRQLAAPPSSFAAGAATSAVPVLDGSDAVRVAAGIERMVVLLRRVEKRVDEMQLTFG